jgi:TonB family protein
VSPREAIQTLGLPSGSGLRRALIVSSILHVLAFVTVGLLARPHYRVPQRLPVIPVSLVGLAAPAPGQMVREKPSAARVAPAPAVKAKVKKVDPESIPLAKTKAKPQKPVEQKPKETEEKPARPKQGSADTTRVAPSQLPAVGDLRGWMQVQVEGPILAYSYYLSVVQQKISSYWEPPLGLEQAGREVNTTLWFRIERDGRLGNNYVEEPSGSHVFDTSALRALALAAPLPPLPAEYPGDYLIIHLRFVYAR